MFIRGLVSWIVSPALTLGLAVTALAQAPPSAFRGDSADHAFGRALPDPYRWMEGEHNARFAEWLRAQGTAGRRWLDASPALERWRARLTTVSSATTTYSGQHRVAGRIFFMRLERGHQGVLMERLPSGEERTLLDPNALSASAGHASITTYAVSQDGRRVAVNVDHGGSEVTSIEFYDADTGAKLPDRIDRVWGEFNADWLPDGSGIVYTQMAPATPGADIQLNMRSRLHRLGSDTSGDPVIAAAETNPAFPLDPHEFPVVLASTASDWALALGTGARPESRVCVVHKSELLQAHAPFNCLVAYDDHVQVADLRGSTLYMLSARHAPNGRLLALDLNAPHPSLSRARVLVPEKPQDVLTGFSLARDAIYLRYMHDGIDHLLALPYDGSAPRRIDLPYAGASYLVDSDPRADGIVFTLQGYTRPSALYAFDPATRAVTDLHLGTESPRDYASTVQVITGPQRRRHHGAAHAARAAGDEA